MDALNISGVIQSWGLSKELQKSEAQALAKNPFEKVRRVWILCVDATIAENSLPLHIKDGILHVIVLNRDLEERLMTPATKKQVLEALLKHCPAAGITDLKIKTEKYSITKPRKPSELVPGLTLHPSYCQPRTKNKVPCPEKVLDLNEAFDYWCQVIENRRSYFPSCSICGGPTPHKEIDAWGHCRICHSVGYQAPPRSEIVKLLKREADAKVKSAETLEEF